MMSTRRGSRRPTQVEIARLAGVSQATVSTVVNGNGAQVSEEKRQRVLDAIAQLGYSVNPMARGLRGGGNRILGLYTFESVFPVSERDFYFPFLLGVEAEAALLGYDMLLFTSAGVSGERSVYAGGSNRLLKADGCVLLGRHLARDDLARLTREDFPFVFIGRREVDGVELSYVGADYAAATSSMVRRLAAMGHRRILLLKQSNGDEPSADREAGHRDGLAEAGLAYGPELVHVISENAEVDAELMRSWIDAGVTAILVEPSESAGLAEAIERAAEQAGIHIPGDCSVVFLGEAPAPTATRIWTSFALPRTEMGREAVQMLVRLLEEPGADAQQVLLPCKPTDGNSIALSPTFRVQA
ncbi:LacI family DNA-binding transcriptional regulator [Homoserinibacter gongjuensis]|jgi:DNA-binding LacI/PurR family transcriptional regulator|uniref:LacI family transcriptional regulator n=1 Tax=Homoserinibacter gongjuensis TaxID=1162968 RepID=A0ABQ6JUG3_9MICO|nr:LacI family transcriptional regulator [Homoserinibacter gongjuensis]